MADENEKKELGDIDDWLADLEGDQGNGEAAEAAGAAGEDSSELDQSDIDQLLAGSGEGPPDAEDAEDASPELDQADIDSLFNDTPQAAASEAAPADSPADDFAVLDQSDLDELLGAGEPAGAKEVAEEGGEPAFAEPPVADETEPPAAKDEFGFDSDDFDVDNFKFDDTIPDIPDESVLTVTAEKGAPPPVEDIFTEPVQSGDAWSGESEPAGQQFAEEKRERRSFLAALPSSINRSTVGASLLSLLVLVGGFYYFLGRKPAPEPAIPPPVQERMVQVLEPEPAAPPAARDELYRMEEPGSAVSMQLAGIAADGGPLSFEIVSPPRYGRLSGEPPRVTYLPNQDFPGEDSFLYQVSDGRLASEPGRIKIVGHSLRVAIETPPEPVAEVARLVPERPVVRARDLTLRTRSTEPLLIDWAEIWRRDNTVPFSSRVRVEILERRMAEGNLVAVSPAAHRYEPAPYFQGEETLSYRFHYAGLQSKPRQLTLLVAMGDPPPAIRLRPLAATYPVGETVVVDARDTLAPRPRDLRFQWEQLSGTTVLLETMTENGAVVRFVAPSSFSTVETPRVVLQVTAIDPAGQRDSQVVEIITPSRRQSALWQGGERRGTSPLHGF